VTVTIGRLRRKLGDPLVITTRPGVGYRIAGPPATPAGSETTRPG
jgi:DNA-binding response OmpR family regulator